MYRQWTSSWYLETLSILHVTLTTEMMKLHDIVREKFITSMWLSFAILAKEQCVAISKLCSSSEVPTSLSVRQNRDYQSQYCHEKVLSVQLPQNVLVEDCIYCPPLSF